MGNEVTAFLQELDYIWDFIWAKFLQLLDYVTNLGYRFSEVRPRDDFASDQPRRESLLAWWRATGQKPKPDPELDPPSPLISPAEPILKLESSERSSCKDKKKRDQSEVQKKDEKFEGKDSKKRDSTVSFEAKPLPAQTVKEDEDPEPLLAEVFENIFSRRASFKVKAELAEKELYQKQLKVLNELAHKTELTDEDKKKLEYIDDNRQAYLNMDPRMKGKDSITADGIDDDIFSRRGSFKVKAIECEKEIRRNFEAAKAGKSDLSKELLCAIKSMKQDEQTIAPKSTVSPDSTQCPGCSFEWTPSEREDLAVAQIFRKVDGAIKRLRKEVNSLRTFEGSTLEEVCPGLNDALDQFIKEILNFKEAKVKNIKSGQKSEEDNIDGKSGLKPKPGSREISFSLTSLTESTLGRPTNGQERTRTDPDKTEPQVKPAAASTAPVQKPDMSTPNGIEAVKPSNQKSSEKEPTDPKLAAPKLSNEKSTGEKLTTSRLQRPTAEARPSDGIFPKTKTPRASVISPDERKALSSKVRSGTNPSPKAVPGPNQNALGLDTSRFGTPMVQLPKFDTLAFATPKKELAAADSAQRVSPKIDHVNGEAGSLKVSHLTKTSPAVKQSNQAKQVVKAAAVSNTASKPPVTVSKLDVPKVATPKKTTPKTSISKPIARKIADSKSDSEKPANLKKSDGTASDDPKDSSKSDQVKPELTKEVARNSTVSKTANASGKAAKTGVPKSEELTAGSLKSSLSDVKVLKSDLQEKGSKIATGKAIDPARISVKQADDESTNTDIQKERKAGTPLVDTPEPYSPKLSTPKLRSPRVATSKARTPRTRTPKARTPKAPTPTAHTPSTRTPRTRTPKARTPRTRTPKARTPRPRTPRPRTPRARTPTAQTPTAKTPKNGSDTDEKARATKTNVQETSDPESQVDT